MNSSRHNIIDHLSFKGVSSLHDTHYIVVKNTGSLNRTNGSEFRWPLGLIPKLLKCETALVVVANFGQGEDVMQMDSLDGFNNTVRSIFSYDF